MTITTSTSSRVGIVASLLLLASGLAFAQGAHGPMASTTGKVIVASAIDKPVGIWLDADDKLGDVPPGGSVTFEKVRGGTQRLRAHTPDLERAWEVQLEVTNDGPRWQISREATGGLRVLNYTAEPLKVFVERIPYLVIPAGGEGYLHYSGSSTTRMIGAETESGRMRYAARLMTLEEGKVRDWKIGTAPKGAETKPAP